MVIESLTLKRLTVHELQIPFRLRFRHAAAVRKKAEFFLVVLTSDSGVEGYGECHPRSYVTGEDMEGALRDITKVWWPRLRGLGLSNKVTPREPLHRLYEEADATGRVAAYGALDIAAFDLWGRAFKVPGRRLFGVETASAPPVSAPIDLAMPPALFARVYKALGFRDLKVKVGGPNDLARLRSVRNAVGPDTRIRVDANGAWTAATARTSIELMNSFGITSVEQPLPKEDRAGLVDLARAQPVPVMADESLCTTVDAKSLLAENAPLQWNIRLGKVGGFSGALALLDLAKSKSVPYQLGALVGETSLLTAAQRALLSVADPLVVDSSFPKILLAMDPFRGGPAPFSTKAQPLGMSPGLDVTLNPGALTRYCTRTIVLE